MVLNYFLCIVKIKISFFLIEPKKKKNVLKMLCFYYFCIRPFNTEGNFIIMFYVNVFINL